MDESVIPTPAPALPENAGIPIILRFCSLIDKIIGKKLIYCNKKIVIFTRTAGIFRGIFATCYKLRFYIYSAGRVPAMKAEWNLVGAGIFFRYT
ncbi:MAG TPA: hypothetical protein PLQ45_06320 [Anaerohalosphaeraceae bacterium]|nr:hypothetical protein [Anaerohalosphaeraceae bacterium]